MLIIVSRELCPYCKMAKDLVSSLGYKYEEIDLTNDEKKLREIMKISEMMTVPQIFIGEIKKENLIGGYSELAKLQEEGKLLDILEKA